MDAVVRNGRIHVSAEHDDGFVVFAVEDNGPGVPAEELSRIFDAFFSTKGSKGTGLGLAMVAKFCEEHGGVAVARRGGSLGGLRVEMRLPFQPAIEFV